jgi:hypothetical protein
MSDVPDVPTAAPTVEPAPTLVERIEGAIEAVAKDVGYPWWVTSDPMHPVNQRAAADAAPAENVAPASDAPPDAPAAPVAPDDSSAPPAAADVLAPASDPSTVGAV